MIKRLLSWYKQNGRHDLPWRKTRNPYHILVSELMLQQTQVPRVIPKYEAFLRQFPTLKALAAAPRKDVLKAWQGLGYNSRAARLHALANAVTTLPRTREALLALPGIGPYTAGAIIIFSQDTPAFSIDVNIERVLKRVYWPKTITPNNKDVAEKALQLITDSGKPHDWHSALMDFGSSICTRTPHCLKCPIRSSCKSRGARPDEHVTKQSKFHGSTRWHRGQLLKQLLEKPLHATEITTEAQPALAALVKEGLVVKKRTKYYIC